jgi:hypothetical protein
MQKTFKQEDIEQILAEADELLQQIDPEIIAYMEEEQRIQLEQQAQSLKNSSLRFRTRSGSNELQRAVLIAKACTRRLRIL